MRNDLGQTHPLEFSEQNVSINWTAHQNKINDMIYVSVCTPYIFILNIYCSFTMKCKQAGVVTIYRTDRANLDKYGLLL